MSTRRPVAPDGVGGLSQIVSPDTLDATILPARVDAVYGDGSDGTVTFDGSATVSGSSRSGSAYTLTRDLYLASATVNNGVTVVTAGFRLFVRDTLTNNGLIHNNGGNTVSSTPSGGNGAPLNSYGATTINGGSAGTGAGGGSIGQSNSFGATGGTGGAGSAGAGGTAGGMTAPPAALGTIRAIPQAITALPQGTSQTMFRAGGGGGGGGGDSTNSGAGGGGGGGACLVAARIIAGTGTIQARGGNSVARIPATGNTGGGGGGGGGFLVVVSSSVVSGAVAGQTIDANGGTASVGAGTGTAGANGSAGTVVLLAN